MGDQADSRVAPITLLLALLADSSTAVCITHDKTTDTFCVLAGHVAGQAQTLGGALGRVYEAFTADEPINVLHAKQRARVRLPEGGLGTLTRIGPRSRQATVLSDEGRWRHVPVRSLTLYAPEPTADIATFTHG